MKELWGLLPALGVLAFWLGVVSLLAAAIFYPLYFGIAVLLLLCWISVTAPRIRKEAERRVHLVNAAFHDAYAHLPNPPCMKISSTHGFPVFEIKFRSKAERDTAAAQNEDFKSAIDEIYKGSGLRMNPFSAERAIFFTYEGHVDELIAEYQRRSV